MKRKRKRKKTKNMANLHQPRHDISLGTILAMVHWTGINWHQKRCMASGPGQTILCTSIHHPTQQHNPETFLPTLANSLQRVDLVERRFQNRWQAVVFPSCRIARSIVPLCCLLLLKAELPPQNQSVDPALLGSS